MFVIVLLWNFLVFIVYGMDKLKAVKKLTRLPEWMLLFFALLFGGIGAMFGMVVFNHKTSKIKFRILVPLCAVLNILVLNADLSTIFTEIIRKIG